MTDARTWMLNAMLCVKTDLKWIQWYGKLSSTVQETVKCTWNS